MGVLSALYTGNGRLKQDFKIDFRETTKKDWKVTWPGVIAAPVAGFTGTPLSGAASLAVTFTNSSTGSITSYLWNFGDGSTSTAASPSHTYTDAGTYTVTLTVTGRGGSSTLTRTAYVTVS